MAPWRKKMKCNPGSLEAHPGCGKRFEVTEDDISVLRQKLVCSDDGTPAGSQEIIVVICSHCGSRNMVTGCPFETRRLPSFAIWSMPRIGVFPPGR